MKKFLFAAALSLLTLSSFAETYKIKSSNAAEPRYVKIVENGDRMSISYCDNRSNRCEQLGPNAVYSKKSLLKKHDLEIKRMWAVVAADAGLSVAAVYGGILAYIGLYQTTSVGSSSIVLFFATPAISVTLANVAMWTSNTFNPLVYKRRANTISYSVAGKNFVVKDIDGYKTRLEDMLYKLNESINPFRSPVK